MARTVKITLEGGPCNGRVVTQPALAAFTGYVIVCKGIDYTVAVQPDGSLIATAPASAGSGSPPTVPVPPSTYAGWRHLKHAVNVTLPHALTSFNRDLQAARALIAHTGTRR